MKELKRESDFTRFCLLRQPHASASPISVTSSVAGSTPNPQPVPSSSVSYKPRRVRSHGTELPHRGILLCGGHRARSERRLATGPPCREDARSRRTPPAVLRHLLLLLHIQRLVRRVKLRHLRRLLRLTRHEQRWRPAALTDRRRGRRSLLGVLCARAHVGGATQRKNLVDGLRGVHLVDVAAVLETGRGARDRRRDRGLVRRLLGGVAGPLRRDAHL